MPDKKKWTDLYPVKYPVQLAESRIDGPSDLINYFLEYCVFFRWIAFKNRPRGNLLLLRSFLIVSAWAVLYFQFRRSFELILLGIDIDPVLFYFGGIVAGYWSMLNAFYNKSAACNQMYLEMVKSGGIGNTIAAKLISTSLAIELLTMDLWAHRKYRSLFARNLFRAIEHAYSDQSALVEFKMPSAIEQMLERVNAGKLENKEARLLLENYQNFLMHTANTIKT